MRLAEEKKIVPIFADADYGGGATGDSINMKNFHRCTFILTFGVNSGNGVLTVHSGATDGAATSNLTFHYASASADIGTNTSASVSGDVLAADATAATLTLTAASFNSRMLVVEVDASDMDVANGEEWLTLVIDNSATSGIVHGVAILEPRYTENLSVSACV